MSDFLRTYGTTLGPVGVPMTDEQAFALDAVLKQLPAEDQRPRKAQLPAALLSLEPGERADVSWITTEAVDREQEIVLAAGMNDGHFRLNPLVTLGHNYWLPPVGRSLWRKAAAEDGRRGVLAKPHYPTKPDGWIEPWTPDEVFMLIQAGLMNGKSVGFIPLKRHSPTEQEVGSNPALKAVRSIVDDWLLLEYACCPIPHPHDTMARPFPQYRQRPPAPGRLQGFPVEDDGHGYTRPRPPHRSAQGAFRPAVA